MQKAIICDIDDTIVAPAKNYEPIKNVVDFLIENSNKYKIIMLTARIDTERDFTIKQLRDLKIPFDRLIMDSFRDKNHEDNTTVEHGIYKANEVRKLMTEFEVVLFIDNSKHARTDVKKLGIKTKKPENITPTVLTKTIWSGTFI
jgi:FMN phosphatase YigB (HAD superfamily)